MGRCRWAVALVVFAGGLGSASDARASACTSGSTGSMNCNGPGFGRGSVVADLPGESDVLDGYACVSGSEHGPERITTFTCAYDTWVDVDMTNTECDVNLYVLDGLCDPAGGCTDFDIDPYQGQSAVHSVGFFCQPGQTFFLVVEGTALRNPLSAAACPLYSRPGVPGAGPGSSFDLIQSCDELCGDARDNDRDGAVDCDDADCATDPVCTGVEDCTVAGDEDGDGLFDCDDPDCDDTAACCDLDGDGVFADVFACSFGGDCDDGDGTVFPGAPEGVADGLDQDCDGVDDCWRDLDADGVGGPIVVAGDDLDCTDLVGESAVSGDCDDDDPAVFPGADEVVGDGLDQDCGGGDACHVDLDGDGYGTAVVVEDTDLVCGNGDGLSALPGDCLDVGAFGPSVFPGAPETCSGRDDDCDGLVDEEDPDLVGGTTFHEDLDGDGAGGATSVTACTAPPGFVATDGDCDDTDPDRSPSALETADGIDEDCDGTVDEGTVAFDDDGDGWAELGGDCDDADPAVHPGAAEVCDGVDGDCDGGVDEGTPCVDDDGDGYAEDDGDCHDGDPTIHPGAADPPGDGVDDDCDGVLPGEDGDGDGVTAAAGDCDDADPAVGPGAPELPDGVDQDCDGVVDEGTTAFDDDGDGTSEDDGDCHDGDPAVGPHAPEDPSNRRDDDCDGTIDEEGPAHDDDGDGFTEDGGDCDDADADVFPGAEESADGVDEDCDGTADEGLADADGDGWTVEAGDCDDRQGFANPEASESCDGIDNDCDGAVDEGCLGREDPSAPTVEETAGCGCAAAPGGGGPGGLWLALGLAWRRRQGRDRAADAAG